MVTYGDIMTLLLTFFVLLISYSTIHEEAFKRALASFQEALGVLPYERSVIQFEQVPAVRLGPPIPPHEIIKRIRTAAYAAGMRGKLRVRQEREGVRITIQTPILFDSGKADLRSEAYPFLDELTKILLESPNTVVVEGHTDNVPISTPEFPSNWELSTARAISVAKYIFEKGEMAPSRFTVAGYGEYHPVATNETEEGRQENRRVEILLRNIEDVAAEQAKRGAE
jgi:chemotaxis protein MotB